MKYTLTGWKAKVRCTKHFKWRFPGESLMRQLYARTGYLQAKISTSKKTIRARLIKKKKKKKPFMVYGNQSNPKMAMHNNSPLFRCLMKYASHIPKSYFIILFYLFISPMWRNDFRLRWGMSVGDENKTNTQISDETCRKKLNKRKRNHTVCVSVILITYN